MFKYIITLLILFIINLSVLSIYTVTSASMEDTLLVGDTFVVLKFWYGFKLPFTDRAIIGGFEPVTNEILLFKNPVDPEQVYIKRCVAVGGQSVEIVGKKHFVDDVEIPLPQEGKHADPITIPGGPYGSGKRDFRPKETVPDSAIYVLGDNRDYSIDSRMWGFLPKKNLLGKMGIMMFSVDPEVPWSDIKSKVRWERILKRIK